MLHEARDARRFPIEHQRADLLYLLKVEGDRDLFRCHTKYHTSGACQNLPMTYDDIMAVFCATPIEPIPVPVVPATSARRLRDALEPIATHGWWSRPPSERIAALGLGFFDGYVWGRAAALGTPHASVVVATFGVFEPGMLSAVYQHATSVASRDDVLAARADGAAESLATLVSADDAAAIADPLLAALSDLDGMGRPLFSALRGLPLPDTAHGRLWRAAELVREHRGDGHLAAAVAAGFDAITLNVVTELWLGYAIGEYSHTRGFTAEHLGAAVGSLERRGWVSNDALTAAGLHARLEVEHATDVSQQPLIDLLGDDLDDVISRAETVSSQILAARAFPTDPRKRAAG